MRVSADGVAPAFSDINPSTGQENRRSAGRGLRNRRIQHSPSRLQSRRCIAGACCNKTDQDEIRERRFKGCSRVLVSRDGGVVSELLEDLLRSLSDAVGLQVDGGAVVGLQDVSSLRRSSKMISKQFQDGEGERKLTSR